MMIRVSCVSVDLINADKPPAALAFLAGACEQVGAEYHAISLNSEFLKCLSADDYNQIYKNIKLNKLSEFNTAIDPIISSIIDRIQEFRSEHLLVSLFSWAQFELAEFLLSRIRQSDYQGSIIAGGPGVGPVNFESISNGRRLAQKGLIDFYCLGEGDRILPLYLMGNTKQIGLNSRRSLSDTWVPQIDDLEESYLVPSYKKIDTVGYKNLEAKSETVYSLSTSRGCVRRCTFCDVGKSWPKFRFRSGAMVAKEVLKHHTDVGAVHFTIVDSLINGSLKAFKDFNEAMVSLKKTNPTLSDFSYNGMFIVRDKKSHPEDFFALMKDAGCDSLAIGVETGSDRLRFEMDKKFTNDDLDHHLEMCQKYGIRNTFLTFVGYPTETRQDFEQTLEMLHRYQKYLIDDTIIGINHSGVFNIIPHTPVYDQREDLGIELARDNHRSLAWHNTKNPELTVKERILRDLVFRRTALELRYPIPYSERYLEYLKDLDQSFVPESD